MLRKKGTWFVVASVLVLIVCWATMAFILNYSAITLVRNTEYAPGYSDRAFRAVAYGDSEEQVLALLGEPLVRHHGGSNTSHLYLMYSRPVRSSGNYFSRIIILSNGRVTGKRHELYVD
jgi:outer membrane protein assembly factor BamE (lipoprotein component of BamABCDE complex)